MGVWNMYLFNTTFGESRFGIQGDYQFRFWDAYTDLEQLLLRTGFTYKPKEANVLLTLGYGNITTGEPGDGNSTVNESRVYQEALLPHKVAKRVLLNHRFRFEQRWVDSQDLRTRYRYNLFINIPFNMDALDKGVIYLALYNEIFINGQRSTGNGSVQYFDRNRAYAAMGYGLLENLRIQLGMMNQTTVNRSKNQLQLSLHHSF